jgi:hypothetical protein
MDNTESEIGFAQLGLGSVLKQNQLAVPPNQREYAWEQKEVRTLLQDFSRAIGDGDRSYFLGTVVTIPRANGILEVVDGQQRLATTAILLSAIRDYLKHSEAELADSINSEFLTVYNRNTRTRGPRLQLNLDDNDYFWAKLRGDTDDKQTTKTSHGLLRDAFIEAARHIKSVVAGFDSKEHGNVLNRWVDFIETRASVILLRVPNAANAFRMFETLNDRGKRTSQSDLVKNYLFGYAGDRLPEAQQKWAAMRGALESMEDEDTTITFLRHSLTAIRGFVREADVYEAVQKYAKGKQPVVTFSGQLEVMANAFVAVHNPEHERWNKHSDSTRRALDVLNLFSIKPMRPLLISIAERLSENEAKVAFAFCVSLCVRLMVASSTRTSSVEEGLADAAHKIFNGSISSAKELIAHLKPLIPTDGQFRAAFEVATVSNRKLARYYLRSLEMAAKGESEPWHVPNDDHGVINLEHIMPEKTMNQWPQFSDDEVKIYKNRIGNLALLRASENSDLKSIDFATKRSVYATSPYVLTSQMAQAADWTSAEIIARQKILADLAVKAWSI